MSRCGSCPAYGCGAFGIHCSGDYGVEECSDTLQELHYATVNTLKNQMPSITDEGIKKALDDWRPELNHIIETLGTEETKELKYFEVKFSDGDEVNAVWVCIRGTDEPTVEEAQWFMASDSAAMKLPVAEVCEIDEQTARGCYDFDNETNWPIFSKGGGLGGKKIEG